jgi:16S rRNA (cytidine1402-2'-O)-methyltransferase
MGTLYVVATPIGNLEDVTLRALRVLRECDDLLAEDTRRTRVLLEHHGIAARPRALHAHNEAARTREVLALLAEGRDVALVSDAGTPLVSDPGERLTAAVRAAGHTVVPVPGASALLAALVASGLPAVPFLFEGFLPRRAGERRARLVELRDRPETLVLFESPRRLAATLLELAEALGPRRACVARELTKRFEETRCGTLPELAEAFSEGARGEITLVVGGAAPAARPRAEDLDAQIRARLAAGESPRAIASALSASGAVARRDAYQRALALRRTGP